MFFRNPLDLAKVNKNKMTGGPPLVLFLAEAATANSSNHLSGEAGDVNRERDLTNPPHYASLLGLDSKL